MDGPLRCDILVRLAYVSHPEEEWICALGRAEAFPTNFANTSETEIQEGEVVTGIPTATYGNRLAAVFNTWVPATLDALRQESVGRTVLATNTKVYRKRLTST